MNIIEETVGTYRVEITGMTIRQIKDVFEDKWGAMVWSGGAAYPSGDIKLQFKKALAALDAAQPVQVNAMLLKAANSLLEQAPCDCSRKRRFDDGEHMSGCYLFDLNLAALTAALTAAQQTQPEPSEMTKEREAYIAGLESRTHEMRKKIEQLDYELRVARSLQERATYTPPKISDPDAPHPCFN